MQLTSEERRKMKERLMQIADEYAAKAPVVIKNPTCHMICRGSFTARHDFTRWECSECGAYAFAPGKWNAPRFCPHCGCRCINDEVES